MRSCTTHEAKTRFEELLDQAQRGPVRVLRNGRVVGVMVSAEDYEAMRAFYANRLVETMDEIAAAAERASLTSEKLTWLLADPTV